VDIPETPLDHQIRRSNSYALRAILDEYSVPSEIFHFNDDKEILLSGIEETLKNFDVLMLSGGVSKGKFDWLPEVFDELGVEKIFHRVKQRPGKPFWFGHKQNKVVFAFPGNPVSSMVCCYHYFLPWLFKTVGYRPEPKLTAILSDDFTFKPVLTYFLQVRVEVRNGRLYAIPEPGKGSGDHANLRKVDGFLVLEENVSEFEKDTSHTFIPIRRHIRL
jgi:molybdopterin molybdotransferase